MAAGKLTIKTMPALLRTDPDWIWAVDYGGRTTTAKSWPEALLVACHLGWFPSHHNEVQRARSCRPWVMQVVASLARETA